MVICTFSMDTVTGSLSVIAYELLCNSHKLEVGAHEQKIKSLFIKCIWKFMSLIRWTEVLKLLKSTCIIELTVFDMPYHTGHPSSSHIVHHCC